MIATLVVGIAWLGLAASTLVGVVSMDEHEIKRRLLGPLHLARMTFHQLDSLEEAQDRAATGVAPDLYSPFGFEIAQGPVQQSRLIENALPAKPMGHMDDGPAWATVSRTYDYYC